MHRRSFIKTASLAAVAGVTTTGCGTGGVSAENLPTISEEQGLFVQVASLEILTGRDRYLAFGAGNADLSPLPEDQPLQVFLRTIPITPDDRGELVAGPLDATFSPAEETGLGVYYLRTDLDQAGLFEVVAVSGEEFGTAALQVVDPAESQLRDPSTGDPLIPGSMAVSAPTPTTADDLGVFSICTQDPPCGMHEMSLDEALATGQPVALIFATPQFCQTAVCGPSVATLDSLRTGGDWGDTLFIHSEIFASEPSGANVAATPTTEAVTAWGLPSEPWLFTIHGDGTILGRLDGPMPSPILESMLQDLTA
ncbi:MAG: twin-arginine translocation signal domain-containing protein [Euzebya sp.]